MLQGEGRGKGGVEGAFRGGERSGEMQQAEAHCRMQDEMQHIIYHATLALVNASISFCSLLFSLLPSPPFTSAGNGDEGHSMV